MKRPIIRISMLTIFLGTVALAGFALAVEIPVSDLTDECLGCHVSATPGIVEDWRRSRHSKTTPAAALKNPKLERRISVDGVPKELADVAVGCAECHMRNPGGHKDTFVHNDQKVHVTVSPNDCSTCHPIERKQFEKNLMSHARTILVKNELYQVMANTINGVQSFKNMKTTHALPNAETNADSCYHCHGTEVKVIGKETRETDQGEMEFPVLSGWPNQGVGRYNPDGSHGSCTACHSRHQFSITMARKPYTCSQCHKGPDVPAYPAYNVSKHGNLQSALSGEWNFEAVPWTVGKDFTAPTCAACHISLTVDEEGTVVAERTHQMNDRLPWRILGLIYAHPHTKSPDTSIVRNKAGLPLPTSFDGEPASKFLISKEEMEKRRKTLQKVCLACHGTSWVNGHWRRFENTIEKTNAMTLTATKIIQKAWDDKVADPDNVFDEAIEKKWVEQWLFYANSTRFASAMMGADYGVFANGRWYMAKTVQELLDSLKLLQNLKETEK
jgi:hydroxylamine dehydrogenase